LALVSDPAEIVTHNHRYFVTDHQKILVKEYSKDVSALWDCQLQSELREKYLRRRRRQRIKVGRGVKVEGG
jgi:hypothetical protein